MLPTACFMNLVYILRALIWIHLVVGYEKIPMNDSIYIREIVYTTPSPPPLLDVVVTTWPRWRYAIKGWMWG